MSDKSKGGRPPAPPGLRRVNVPLRLPYVYMPPGFGGSREAFDAMKEARL
jgi:hypothetical protein